VLSIRCRLIITTFLTLILPQVCPHSHLITTSHQREFSPGSHLIDIFPSHFSFHPYTKCKDYNFEDHTNQLNDIVISLSLNLLHTLIISDTGVKNNVVMSITHIHIYNRPIIKMIHHTANITLTEAELFTIRCGINQMTNLLVISKIIIITDSIHTARSIFNSSIYPL